MEPLWRAQRHCVPQYTHSLLYRPAEQGKLQLVAPSPPLGAQLLEEAHRGALTDPWRGCKGDTYPGACTSPGLAQGGRGRGRQLLTGGSFGAEVWVHWAWQRSCVSDGGMP